MVNHKDAVVPFLIHTVDTCQYPAEFHTTDAAAPAPPACRTIYTAEQLQAWKEKELIAAREDSSGWHVLFDEASLATGAFALLLAFLPGAGEAALAVGLVSQLATGLNAIVYALIDKDGDCAIKNGAMALIGTALAPLQPGTALQLAVGRAKVVDNTYTIVTGAGELTFTGANLGELNCDGMPGDLKNFNKRFAQVGVRGLLCWLLAASLLACWVAGWLADWLSDWQTATRCSVHRT